MSKTTICEYPLSCTIHTHTVVKLCEVLCRCHRTSVWAAWGCQLTAILTQLCHCMTPGRWCNISNHKCVKVSYTQDFPNNPLTLTQLSSLVPQGQFDGWFGASGSFRISSLHFRSQRTRNQENRFKSGTNSLLVQNQEPCRGAWGGIITMNKSN